MSEVHITDRMMRAVEALHDMFADRLWGLPPGQGLGQKVQVEMPAEVYGKCSRNSFVQECERFGSMCRAFVCNIFFS